MVAPTYPSVIKPRIDVNVRIMKLAREGVTVYRRSAGDAMRLFSFVDHNSCGAIDAHRRVFGPSLLKPGAPHVYYTPLPAPRKELRAGEDLEPRLIAECQRQYLVHVLHEHDLQIALHVLGDLNQILAVA